MITIPHFKPEEIYSPECLKLLDRKVLPAKKSALLFLGAFRQFVGVRLVCNFGEHQLRGVCGIEECLRAGRSGFSFHSHCAFDLHSPDLPIEELKGKAENFGWPGIGFYPEKGFIHVDFRDGPQARWIEQSQG